MKDAWRRERIAHGIVFDRELDMWIEKKRVKDGGESVVLMALSVGRRRRTRSTFVTTTMMLAVITLHAILCSTGGAITSISPMTRSAHTRWVGSSLSREKSARTLASSTSPASLTARSPHPCFSFRSTIAQSSRRSMVLPELGDTTCASDATLAEGLVDYS